MNAVRVMLRACSKCGRGKIKYLSSKPEMRNLRLLKLISIAEWMLASDFAGK